MDSASSSKQDDAKTIKLLAKGLLEVYEPPLTTINTHLKELTEKQETVHTMIVSERRKLEDLQNDAMLDAMLADIATNKERLVSVSNSMMSLHKRVQSLQEILERGLCSAVDVFQLKCDDNDTWPPSPFLHFFLARAANVEKVALSKASRNRPGTSAS